MPPPAGPDDGPIQPGPGLAPLTGPAEALLRALLRMDAEQVRCVRAALPPRRRVAGMTGPAADLGDDGPDDAT